MSNGKCVCVILICRAEAETKAKLEKVSEIKKINAQIMLIKRWVVWCIFGVRWLTKYHKVKFLIHYTLFTNFCALVVLVKYEDHYVKSSIISVTNCRHVYPGFSSFVGIHNSSFVFVINIISCGKRIGVCIINSYFTIFCMLTAYSVNY